MQGNLYLFSDTYEILWTMRIQHMAQSVDIDRTCHCGSVQREDWRSHLHCLPLPAIRMEAAARLKWDVHAASPLCPFNKGG